MEAVEYIKAKNRMTKECSIQCYECPLWSYNNGKGVTCGRLEREHPEIYVAIVEDWAKKHPEITRQSELLKLFPDLSISKDGFLDLCPKYMDKGFACPEHGRCYHCRKEYWLGEVEEGETKK